MPRKNLPFVNSYRDRTGKMRYYLRRPGCRQVALAGLPGSREFLRSYAAATAAPAKLKKVKPKVPGKGHVYYAVMADLIKIGFTTDLKQRERTYRTHAADAVRIVATHPGTMFDEKQLHKQFAAHKIPKKREWFCSAPEILAHIDSINTA